MIRFQLPAGAVDRVRFAYSPLFEAVLSLHVLVEPNHHPLQHDWVRRMRSLPERLRRDLHAFAFAYRDYLPEVLAPGPLPGYASFEDDLARFREQPAEAVAFEFTMQLTPFETALDPDRLDDPATRAAITRRGSALGRESGRLVRLLLDEPATFSSRFVDFLHRYWQAGFAAEWKRLEPLLAADVSEAGRHLATSGLYGFLPRLSPELLVDTVAETIAIDRDHDHELTVDEHSTLRLTPSFYVWPHVRVTCDPPWPLALTYPAPTITRRTQPHLPPAELLRILRALADPARLEMLRLIAARPRSTQELARLIAITDAGASRSLRLLSEAGILTSQREGRYLLYQLVPDRLELTYTLASFLATAIDAPAQPDGGS